MFAYYPVDWLTHFSSIIGKLFCCSSTKHIWQTNLLTMVQQLEVLIVEPP